ncbi:MAG: GAF domain-containing protein [Actinomycetota bacterium]|nr:GAF domain-containing protein [Actinomycetota bacterium]
MEEAVAAARLLELDRYDAVVVDLGLADAMAGTTPREWAAHLEVLLHILSSQVPRSARVFFIESPDPTIVPLFRSPQGGAVAKAFQRFNEKSREVINGFENVSFVPFPVQHESPSDRLHTARTFEGFAVTLAPSLVNHLEAEFMAGSPRSDPIASEARRQASLEGLGILDTAPEPRFDRIVAQAQRVFATGYASFNLIDHDRRWSKSHLGPSEPVGVRATEFCNTTIHSHGGLIIGDTFDDPRFCDNPYVAGDPHVRFYAGYPIEAPDGQRVGALCVYDTQPRQLHGQEESLLRELATKIERELWATPETRGSGHQLAP